MSASAKPGTFPAKVRRRRLGAAAAAVLVLTLGGCGSGESVDDGAAPTDLGAVADLTGKPEVEIEVGDNTFVPAAFKVSVGTKVVFRNKGAQPHDVTPAASGSFEKGMMRPGATVEITAPQSARTYRFYCSLHGTATGGQRGAMVVV